MQKQSQTTDGYARLACWDGMKAKLNFTGSTILRQGLLCALALVLSICSWAATAGAVELDRMDIERWKKLRETERYQLNIAEKYYNDKEWEIAAAEYEKYLTLYEQSEAAGYSQLKWAICQSNLRLKETAIKEGYQSVIDYWPETEDAIVASYFIASTYREIGEIKKAKKAYQYVLENHPEHLVAAYSMRDLIDITNVEEDGKARVALWKKLAFDVKRSPREIERICASAANDLATYYFYMAAFDEAIEALKTNYADNEIPGQIIRQGSSAIQNMTGDEKSKEKGNRVADQAISYIHANMPSDWTKEEQKNLAKQFWYYTADLESYARRYEKVPKVYEQMMTKFGVDDGILGRLAEWFKGQNNYEQARATYGRFEDKIEGQNQIAYSFVQQGKIDEAVGIYRKLALQDPDKVAHWTLMVAQTYRNAKRYKEAIEAYTELLAIDPDRTDDWHYAIGDAHHHAGQYKEAIASYRVCNKAPDSYFRMASCHRALKQYGEAILMYNQVMGAFPGGSSAEALLQIGYTQEQAGQPEKAIKSFQTVCDKYTDHGQASTAHNHLKAKYKITATKAGKTSK